jgi:hypothetical protein
VWKNKLFPRETFATNGWRNFSPEHEVGFAEWLANSRKPGREHGRVLEQNLKYAPQS